MSGPGMVSGSSRSGVTEFDVAGAGRTPLVPFGPQPPGKVRRRRRRGPIALEVEADRIAAAVAAGRRQPTGTPTPTPAASMRIPGSPGRAIESLLLRRLEDALHADLGRLRVHDDAAAGAAVRAEGADAVTAGAHVFFAPGRFRPDTDGGFRLLVHEVVHSLQQTGRRTVGGRLRVTDSTGSGPLQAQDSFLDRFAGMTGSAVFAEVARLHGADTVDSPLADLVAELRREIGGAIVPRSTELSDLGDAVVAGAFDSRSEQELSYLLDVLKAGRDWNAAAHLIDHTMLFTIDGSSTFIQWLADNRSGAWLRLRVDEHEPLRLFRDYLYGAYRLFLVRPDTSPYRVSRERGEEAVAQPAPWDPDLQIDDRTVLALATLRALDDERYELLRTIHRHIRGRGTGSRTDRALLLFEGKRRAAALNEILTAVPDPPAGSLPGRALTRYKRQAISAEDFWSSQLAAWQHDATRRVQIGMGEIDPDTREAMQQRLPADSVALRAAARVIAGGIQFLDAENANVPGFSAYGRRVDSYRSVVDQAADDVIADLRRFRLDEKTLEQAEANLWVLQRLIQLGYALDRYRGPETDEERLAAQTFDDTRQGHRLEMAVELRRLAIELRNADLEDAAFAIFENWAGGVTRLILVSDWEKPSTTDVRRLTEDFPQGLHLFDQREEGASSFVLPAEVVRDFYLGDHLLTLADALRDLLLPGGDLAAPHRLVVQEAARVANSVPKPNRWFVERGHWAANENETRSIAQVIAQHPKSRAQLPPAGVDNRVISNPAPGVVATPGNVPHEVFTWELPNFDRLLDEVAGALRAVPAIASVTEPVGADSLAWLRALAEIIDNGLIDPSLVRRTMGTHMQERLAGQRRRLGVSGLPPGLLRQGVNHDRLVVADRVRRDLAAYAADPTVTNFERPIDALDLVETFYRYAVPEEDRVAQLAAILVDLAPDLRAAFVRDAWFGMEINEERFDIITGWHGLVLLATIWLGDRQQRRRLVAEFLPPDQIITLGTRSAALNDVLTSFEDVRSRIQSGIGFTTTDEGGFRSLNYPNVIPVGEPFGVGEAYELEQVFQHFTFNPPYGQPGRVIGGVTMGGASEATVKDPDGNDIDPGTVLFRIRMYDEPRQVRAGDVELLEEIYRAVEDEAFARAMQSTLEAIEAMMTLPLDLAEFIPGAGQGLAAARIALSITMFLASAEFDDIKTALSGELFDQIRDLIDNLGDLITPEALWLYLLFGGAGGGMLDRLQNRNPNRRRRRRTRGKMGRLLRTVGRLGTLLARQFEAMQERIQPPLRNAQSFVNTHPVVAYALNLAALAVEIGPSVDETVDGLGSAAAGLEERLEAMLAALEDFELPAEILPLDLLISAVISLVLDRLGAKGKIAEEILDATGLIDKVSEEVADALRANGLDVINNLWRTEMTPVVDQVLDDARQDFLDGVYGALELVGITGIKPTARTITTTTTDGLDIGDGEPGGEAAAPALSVGVDEVDAFAIRTTNGDVIPPGSGSPLPLPVRQDAAKRFGRPLDHVRLHRAPIGDGVDGIARGSHIVMRPGLSLTSGRGRYVLHHELAHVMQQAADTERPTRGRPGTRVRHDPAAEAEADRVAAGGVVPEVFTEVDDDAVVPALSDDVLARVIRRIASYEDLRAFQEDIQNPATRLPPLNQQQRTAVERVHAAFLESMPAPSAPNQIPVRGVPTSVSGATGAEVLAAVREQARSRVRTLFGTNQPTDDFTRLARQALRDVTPRPRGGRSSPGVQEQVFRLEPNTFSALVEGYLLIRSGIVFKVDLGRNHERFLESRAAESFRFEINGLFLGAISRASGLWNLILDHQLAVGRRVVGTETGAITIDASNQLDLYRAVVATIRAYGPRKKALKPSRFELRANIIGEAVDRLAAGLDIDPETLPVPASYTDHDGPIGTFGLRVSDHRTLTSNSVAERDSHHTTQFLLAEFLSNEADYPAFAADGSAVENPGLEYRNGRPMKLHLDGGHVYDFGALFPGRGGLMPAVHLARETHQKARLHVARGRPDELQDAPSTQGGTVSNWFTGEAGTVTGQPLSGSRSAAQARATITDATSDRNQELGDAVQTTYRTMRSFMLGRLRDGLLIDERTFYETVAGRKADRRTPDGDLVDRWKLSDTQLLRVYEAAEQNNDEVMTRYGFRSS